MASRLTPREKVLRLISEAEWQKTVIDILARNGYLVYHDTNTFARQHRAGLPDIVATRMDPPDFFMAELKRELGKLRPEQQEWIESLKANGIDCYVWRPSDAEEVKRRASPLYQKANV